VLRAQTQSTTAVTIVRHARLRRSVPVVAVVAVVAVALAILLGLLVARRSSSHPAPPPKIAPVARSTDAARQARNLIAWIGRYSATP
jgi:hypothetical protein